MTDQQTNGAAAEDNSPQFSLQRIYVRDLSFEAPKSPQIFRQQWEPSVALDLNTKQKALEGDFHEVVLTLSVTVKNGDEVAFIAATRFSRQRMVTVSSDKIDFKKPIPAGTIVELIGKVTYLGSTSLKIRVEIFVEQMYSDIREKAVTGEFTFVAIDENKKPVKILH